MKRFFLFLFLFWAMVSPVHAQEDAWSYTSEDLTPGQEEPINQAEIQEALEPPTEEDENDPLEDFNRGVFWFNNLVDEIFLERLAEMYGALVPEFVRERVGYALRNLSEPIVLVNNLLQGEMEDAADTLGRFVINSTVGVAGLFDVSTDCGIPYKREDFGLTLASWGVGPGPYLVLPILGPSNVRDTFGRIGDYGFDPINWWAYVEDKAVYSNARTGAQILDAKTSSLDIIKDLRENAVDFYASVRTWYGERRKFLILKEKQQALETPRPDDDED